VFFWSLHNLRTGGRVDRGSRRRGSASRWTSRWLGPGRRREPGRLAWRSR